MLIITTAYHREAEALIEHFSLKQNRSFNVRPIFESDSIRLVVTGIGSLNAAIGTTIACADVDPLYPLAIINFGICGGMPNEKIGALFQINKIMSAAARKSHYPDMMLRFGLPESGLETREQAFIYNESIPLTAPLVDMEAFGFFEAARAFVPSSRIFIFKLLSDHGASLEDIKSEISRLLTAQHDQLVRVIEQIESYLNARTEMTREQIKLLQDLRKFLSLSESQYQQLLFLCRARATQGDSGDIIRSFLVNSPPNRESRKTIFTKVINALHIPLV